MRRFVLHACRLGIPLSFWISGSLAIPSAAPGDLSVAEIEAAIELGSTGVAAPYELTWKTSERRQGNTVVGSVYTPFVRVASWVGLRSRNRQLQPHDIPKDLYVDHVLLVAIHSEPRCCPAVIDGPPVSVRAALAVTRSPGALITDIEGQLPLWSTTDLSRLRRFDPDMAARTSALVAIPLEHVRGGYTVVVEEKRRALDGPQLHTFVFNGTIAQEDVDTWR